MSYTAFADVYDRLMGDCDYSARADYLLGLFHSFGTAPKLMLDLACGTGGISIEMLRRGVDVIGVDLSPEMLDKARRKADDAGLDMLCLCQDAAELDLYGTVDSAVCCLDSVNHITDYEQLKAAFAKVALFLEPGGLFIFDVNTEYKHRCVLADNTFVLEDDGLYCVWRNFTDMPYTDICLDFFTEKDGAWARSGEVFSERAYSQQELSQALAAAGFRLEAICSDMTETPACDTDERHIYIARR